MSSPHHKPDIEVRFKYRRIEKVLELFTNGIFRRISYWYIRYDDVWKTFRVGNTKGVIII